MWYFLVLWGRGWHVSKTVDGVQSSLKCRWWWSSRVRENLWWHLAPLMPSPAASQRPMSKLGTKEISLKNQRNIHYRMRYVGMRENLWWHLTPLMPSPAANQHSLSKTFNQRKCARCRSLTILAICFWNCARFVCFMFILNTSVKALPYAGWFGWGLKRATVNYLMAAITGGWPGVAGPDMIFAKSFTPAHSTIFLNFSYKSE